MWFLNFWENFIWKWIPAWKFFLLDLAGFELTPTMWYLINIQCKNSLLWFLDFSSCNSSQITMRHPLFFALWLVLIEYEPITEHRTAKKKWVSYCAPHNCNESNFVSTQVIVTKGMFVVNLCCLIPFFSKSNNSFMCLQLFLFVMFLWPRCLK